MKEEEVEKEPSEWEELPAVLPPDKNAIFLFGMFTILDNAGRDITYMLSPKLRTIFFVYSAEQCRQEGSAFV